MADRTGVVVARGIGVGLIVLGICSATKYWVHFDPAVTSGWTSYSPLTTGGSATSVVEISTASFWLPQVAQLIAGSAFILFSKQIGAWLARGMGDDQEKP